MRFDKANKINVQVCNLRRWVFRCLIAITCVWVIFLFFKSLSKPLDLKNNTSCSTTPSLEIKGFHLIETDKGKKKWELNATKADIYQKEIRLEEVKIKFFYPERRKACSYLIITADRGSVERETKDINVEGAVSVKTSDGSLLKTDSLTWGAEKGIIFTRNQVNFVKDNVIISGRNLEINPKKETIALASFTLEREKEQTLKEPIIIKADNVILDKKQKVTILTGQVVISSGKVEISAEKIRAYGELGEFTKLIAEGKLSIRDKESDLVITGGHLEYFRDREYVVITNSPRLVVPKDNLVVTSKKMERFIQDKRCIAKEEVVILKGDMSLTCGVSEYLETEKKVILTCNPELVKEGNRFSGDKIIYYMESEKIEVLGNVKATITLKE